MTNNCHNKGLHHFFPRKVLGDGGRINWRLQLKYDKALWIYSYVIFKLELNSPKVQIIVTIKVVQQFFTWKVLGDGGRINWRLWHSSWGWSEYLGCYPLDTPPGYPQITWVVLATLVFYQCGACDTKIAQFQPNTLFIITINFVISIYSNLY